jgi:L-amino acid N-acyltransferase YncA
MTVPTILIRRAVIADVAAITEIYNEAIRTTTATFDTEPKSLTLKSASEGTNTQCPRLRFGLLCTLTGPGTKRGRRL